jgi:hypothetical protein
MMAFSLGQSHKNMKPRWIIVAAVTAALCGCASKKASAASARTRPILVRVEEVEREDWPFKPVQMPDGTALLTFLFKSKSRDGLAQLVEPGVGDRRPVELIERQIVVARGWVAGPAHGWTIKGTERYGWVVGFSSPVEAQRAATALQEDPWEALDRHLSDPRTWILPASEIQSTGPRLPTRGLPDPLPKVSGP